METLEQTIDRLSAELTRQEEERERLARIAAENEDVVFAIGDEVDAKIGELLEQIESHANPNAPVVAGVRM